MKGRGRRATQLVGSSRPEPAITLIIPIYLGFQGTTAAVQGLKVVRFGLRVEEVDPDRTRKSYCLSAAA